MSGTKRWTAAALLWIAGAGCERFGGSSDEGRATRAPARASLEPTSAPAAPRDPAPRAEERPAPPPVELPPASARGTLLERLPPSTLFALRFPHVEKLGEAFDRTPIAALLDLPQMAMGRAQIDEGLAQARAKLAQDIPDLDALLAQVATLEGEVVAAVTSFDARALLAPGGGGFPATVCVLFDAGAHAPQADRLVARLIEVAATQAGDPGFERVADGDSGWRLRAVVDGAQIDLAREGTQFLLQVGPQGGTLPQPRPIEASFCAADVVRATPDLAQQGSLPVVEMFLNLEPVLAAAELLAPADVKSVLARSGVASIRGVSMAAGLGERGIDEVVLLHSPGGNDLLTRVLAGRPLDAALARFVPADAESAALTTLDLAALFDGVSALLPDEVRAGLDGGLAELCQRGFDLRGDLIENVGPTFGVVGSADLFSFADPTAIAGLDFTLIVGVRDGARLRKLIDRFLRESGMAAHVRQQPVAGRAASSLEAIPFPDPTGGAGGEIEPCWIVEDDALVFASSRDSLARSLQAASDPRSRGPEDMREALESGGSSLWSVALMPSAPGAPPCTTLGRRTALGLEMTAREGTGATCGGMAAAGTGIVAAVAIPSLLSSRIEANEAAAIADLRVIASAQAQFQALGAIDLDSDGSGEYATLAELTGTVVLRGGRGKLSPPVLAQSMAPDGSGTVTRSGYVLRIDLPRPRGTSSLRDVPPDLAERQFLAYAWPREAGATGRRVFAIDAAGEIFFTDNQGILQGYSGVERAPETDACLLRDDGDRVAGVTSVRRGRDEGIWLELE